MIWYSHGVGAGMAIGFNRALYRSFCISSSKERRVDLATILRAHETACNVTRSHDLFPILTTVAPHQLRASPEPPFRLPKVILLGTIFSEDMDSARSSTLPAAACVAPL